MGKIEDKEIPNHKLHKYSFFFVLVIEDAGGPNSLSIHWVYKLNY